MGIENKTSDFDQALGHETNNGTDMHLSWDDTDGYLLTFPQVDPDLDPLDPIEKIIRIGKNPSHSALVVDYARESAKYTADPDMVCRQTGDFAKKLRQGEFIEETRDDVSTIANAPVWK